MWNKDSRWMITCFVFTMIITDGALCVHGEYGGFYCCGSEEANKDGGWQLYRMPRRMMRFIIFWRRIPNFAKVFGIKQGKGLFSPFLCRFSSILKETDRFSF